MDVAESIVLVPLRDGDGTLNRVDYSLTLDDAYFQARINESDSNARWYFLQGVKAVETERAEDEFEDFPDGTKSKIRDGIRSFSFFVPDVDAYFHQKMEDFQCVRGLGFFIVDRSGNLIGDESVDGFLAPIPIQQNTFSSIFSYPTDSAVGKEMISFDYKSTFKDSDLGYIAASDLAADADLDGYGGLLDLYGGTATAISTTGFTIPITYAFGGVNGLAAEDIAEANFEIYNETTASTVAISTMTESPEGTYAFTFAAQTSADVLQLRIASGVNGFDDTNLRSVDIVIP